MDLNSSENYVYISYFPSSLQTHSKITSKRNKFLVLPHVNTLKEYIYYTATSIGFNKDQRRS